MTRPVVLCADDYGMSEGVSRAIVELGAAGRISATSAMASLPSWPEAAPRLRDLDGRIGIGLHLNFTWGAPTGPMPRLAPSGGLPPLGALLRRAFGGGLPNAELQAEIARQLDRFAEAFGRPPDFVDGHQHVHVLPTIRGALLAELASRGLAGRIWLRDPSDRPPAILRRGGSVGKALFVSALARGFAAAAAQRGFRVNRGFAGFSDFARGGELRSDFGGYLRAPGPAHLVMCHPGHADEAERLDGHADARIGEAAYLASDDFARLLSEAEVRLVPAPA